MGAQAILARTVFAHAGTNPRKSRCSPSLCMFPSTDRAMSLEYECLDKEKEECSLEGLAKLIRKESSIFYVFMVLGGFCSPVDGRCSVRVYTLIFSVSFWICGLTCAWNCVTRNPPFHLFIVDLAVALLHLPGFLAVPFWRRAFGDHKTVMWRIIAKARGHEREWDILCGRARLLGWLMMPVMMGTVFLVWTGFAVPAQIYGLASSHHKFASAHAYSMWAVIPPVVCSILANAAFFGFIILAIIAHIDALEEELLSEIAGSPRHRRIASETGVDVAPAHNGKGSELAGILQRRAEECLGAEEANSVVEDVASRFLGAQDFIDEACRMLSPIAVIHIVMATFQLVAVFIDAALTINFGVPLTVYILCVDLFLVLAALLELLGFLCMGTWLTTKMDALCHDCVRQMLEQGVPLTMAGPSYHFLESAGRHSGTGYKFVMMRLDTSHVAAFISGLCTAVGFIAANIEVGQRAVEVGKKVI
eukprot:NODE_471_length_1542_cov_368.095494.p1 GENE.NODE_471_length_1542_cov_368.095494~~NODE_471_length_1542_cov_368.095494.p1  ORF type:complete len:476 (+),score=143.62 NODE_471_length_1542_cov_368.095494:3-1430(+)